MCGERIRSRGGNHQTLRPDPDAPDEYEKVLWMFIKGTEELEAHEVDDVIEMSISDSIEESVKRAVEGLCKLLPLEKPSEEAIKEAIKHATAYEVPSNKKRVISVPKAPSEEPKKNKKDKGPPRYFGLTPYDFDSSAIASLMEKVVSENPSDTQLSSLWKKMKTKYVAHAPHVTIVHKNNLEDGNGERELWDDCMESTTTDTCPEYRMKITHVVFNDRVAGLVVENLKVDGESTSDPLERLDTTVRDSLHITAGTREGSIRPIEARDLIRAWRKGTMQDGTAIKLGEEIELRLKLERLWS
jgi:tRNA ligase